MAGRAFGLLLSVGPDEVRYDYGLHEQDPGRGVLVIPIGDPARWRIDGREDRPAIAESVVGKAVLGFRADGIWPENASVFTG